MPPQGAIYLDHHATTPVDARVLAAMLPYFTERFGNPHSESHIFGREAADGVEAARGRIAALIGAEPSDIVFTSGATESNNLAIKGAARFVKARRNRVVTLATEHKCVLESVRDLAAEGFEPVILPVEPSGLVDLDLLAAAIDERTALVSVMAAHNEIGVLQDLATIGRLAKRVGALFHTDAAQAFGKIPLDVDAMGIDLMSISGHKIYGPKGIGALYVRRRPRVRLAALFSGGGQERGLRAGTLVPALVAGLGEAASIYAEEAATERQRLRLLGARLLEQLPGAVLNGAAEKRLAGSFNLAFPGVAATALLASLPDLALSTGSACSSAAIETSYVLHAIGCPPDLARSSVRISLGRFTTEAEIDRAAMLIRGAVERLGVLSGPGDLTT